MLLKYEVPHTTCSNELSSKTKSTRVELKPQFWAVTYKLLINQEPIDITFYRCVCSKWLSSSLSSPVQPQPSALLVQYTSKLYNALCRLLLWKVWKSALLQVGQGFLSFFTLSIQPWQKLFPQQVVWCGSRTGNKHTGHSHWGNTPGGACTNSHSKPIIRSESGSLCAVLTGVGTGCSGRFWGNGCGEVIGLIVKLV